MSEHLDEEALLALAAGEAGPVVGQAERTHVQGCADCTRRLVELRALWSLLAQTHALPAVSPRLRARALSAAPRGGRARLYAALAIFASAWLSWFDGQAGAPKLASLGWGSHCLGLESAFALLPLVVGAVLSRAGKLRLEPMRYAAWTMGFAVVGQVVLRSHCRAHDVTAHLFAVHFGGVLLAGAIATGLGRFLLAPSTRA